MNEIEAKILEVDVAATQNKLESLGAKKVFEGEISSVAYDFPDKRFSRQEVLIRLRQRGETAELTVKKLLSKEKTKTSEETEVEVSDFKKTEQILLALGLQRKRGYPLKKRRTSYTLNNVHFEFDTFPQFPTFLEIEAPNYETIKAYAGQLGFSAAQIKPWGVREIFQHYGAEKK